MRIRNYSGGFTLYEVIVRITLVGPHMGYSLHPCFHFFIFQNLLMPTINLVTFLFRQSGWSLQNASHTELKSD